jgi:alanine racemase
MLYGNSPFGTQPHPNTDALRPVMTLVSSVISLRDVAAGEAVGYAASWTAERPSRIATVTIGYGDGYPRLAKNGTPVLVKGQRAPLAGRVSMDMITVDVTELDDIQVGDEVTLWGEGLPVGEVAEWADTIGYELTTRMPMRTPRVVVGE